MDDKELELLDQLIELIEYKSINKLRKFLENVNSADFPSIFEEITEEQIIMVYRLLPKTKAAEVFVELEPSAQENLINYLTDSEIKNVMNEIYMDDAVDLIEEMPANVVKRILANTKPQNRKIINELLKYPDETAGSLMTTEFIDLKENMTVEKAFELIKAKGLKKETVYNCYVTTVDRKLLEEKFLGYIDAIEDADIKTIVTEIVDNHYNKLLLHPAAKTNHHEYAGGLLHHEVSMLDLAKSISSLYPTINKDLLYGGIILHDIGKTIELSGPIATEYTVQGKLIGHISILQSEIIDAAKKHNIAGEVVTLLQHMVLSHHGKLEYGSPVLPVILEAEVMYQIDNIDSKIVMINKALKDVEIGGNSARVMGLDGRSFYKHHKSVK